MRLINHTVVDFGDIQNWPASYKLRDSVFYLTRVMVGK